MKREEIEELKGLAASMGLYDDKNPCKRAVVLGKAIKALEQEPTTKNDLGVDCVARQDVERYIEGFINEYTPKEELEFINLELDGLKHLPSVTPQEPILDKIRAEIEQIAKPNKLGGRGNGKSIRYGLCIALEIIDKYKAESEG